MGVLLYIQYTLWDLWHGDITAHKWKRRPLGFSLTANSSVGENDLCITVWNNLEMAEERLKSIYIKARASLRYAYESHLHGLWFMQTWLITADNVSANYRLKKNGGGYAKNVNKISPLFSDTAWVSL